MRTTVRRRILVFAISMALLAIFVVVATLCIFELVLPFGRLSERNLQTLELIHCKDDGTAPGAPRPRCNDRELRNDWELEWADFVVIKAPRIVIAANPQYRGLWLNFSEPTFMRRFEGFGTWETPTGEVWRLYSERRAVGDRAIAIMVGERTKASWMLVEYPLSPLVDQRLKEELDKIALRVKQNGARIESLRIISNVDGYEIVEADSGRVVRWNGEIPAQYPAGRELIPTKSTIYREADDLFAARADENEDILVVSVVHMGSLWWFLVVIMGTGVLAFLLAYVVGIEWLKRYFTLRGGRPTTVSDALKSSGGEGQALEFKHGLTEDAVLRAVTAFSNTNDGTIFIGIDDEGRVRGLDLPTMKTKDEFRHRVYSLIRDRIQPLPVFDLDFEEVGDHVVARLFVRRGEAPLYYFKGVSYIRHGESNVIPRPEQVTRVLAQYAF